MHPRQKPKRIPRQLDPFTGVTPPDSTIATENALTSFVRLLARQAARETFASALARQRYDEVEE